jgi:rhodanese-related sulfurtransferase
MIYVLVSFLFGASRVWFSPYLSIRGFVMNKWFGLAGLMVLVFGFGTSASAASDGFPGRAKFSSVPTIEMNELINKINDVIIVDTRSEYEFETLRIKDAINIPLGGQNFDEDVLKLRAGTDKPIVFYCNGRTCFKSYEAVAQAQYLKVESTLAFDAGVFEWAKAHPDQAILLGKSPIKVKDLISSDDFKKHLLEPKAFEQMVLKNSIVLDVRDRYQREAISFFPGNEHWVSLNDKKKLNRYIQKAKRNRKNLLVYDEVGKQVRWLQYELEEAGVKDYYFMKGGAKAYYDMISTWKK